MEKDTKMRIEGKGRSVLEYLPNMYKVLSSIKGRGRPENRMEWKAVSIFITITSLSLYLPQVVFSFLLFEMTHEFQEFLFKDNRWHCKKLQKQENIKKKVMFFIISYYQHCTFLPILWQCVFMHLSFVDMHGVLLIILNVMSMYCFLNENIIPCL